MGYNFIPQLRKINVVSIESQNLYKPLTTLPLKYREWEHKKQQKITQPAVSADTADKTRSVSVSGLIERVAYPKA